MESTTLMLVDADGKLLAIGRGQDKDRIRRMYRAACRRPSRRLLVAGSYPAEVDWVADDGDAMMSSAPPAVWYRAMAGLAEVLA